MMERKKLYGPTGENRMDICFVILHYNTYIDTIECVKSIIELEGLKKIVIVDNNSNDGSFEIIRDKFIKYDNIFFIKNKKNMGFASGNNIGYDFAKNKLNSDIIIITNNDVIYDDKLFIPKLIEDFNKTKFYIAGPDIESLIDGKHQNPVKNQNYTYIKIEKELFRYRVLLFLSKVGLYNLFRKLNLKKQNFDLGSGIDYINKVKKNVVLHGSTVIFSSKFIQQEAFAFRPGTFLYLEENILFDYCINKSYTTFYFPDLHLFHKEDSSTNELTFNEKKGKREFIFKNMIKSLKIYKKIITQRK